MNFWLQIFNVLHRNYVAIKGVARTLYPRSENNTYVQLYDQIFILSFGIRCHLIR